MDEFGLDAAILICVSAIADGLNRDEYLKRVPSLLNRGDHFFEMIPSKDRMKVAILFTRQVWNNCPIPAKGYHRDPLPNPKRNDRCLCGSGLKFKQCCRNLPPLPLEKLSMWPYLLDVVSVKQLNEALASRQIPTELYAEIAIEWMEDGSPTKAVRLLEPLFEQGRKIEPRLGFAMSVLCDAFDQLGHSTKKIKFLERIANSKTGVSGDAWQRLVTILLDQNNLNGAAEAFKQAMRSNPEDPNLASLEVLLMIRQGKEDDHIRQRVRFWKQKLRRWGIDDGPIVALLEEAEENPRSALVSGVEYALDPAFITLREWITEVLTPRKIPTYSILAMPPFEGGEDADELEEPWNHLPNVPQGFLETPNDVLQIESQWFAVFPNTKPFSTQPLRHTDAWEQTKWLTFLQKHARAADSLSILDDLVAILEGFPEIGWIGVAESVLEPIYDRARDILLKTMDGDRKDVTLPWAVLENRPALRLLFKRAMQQGGVDVGKEKKDLEELIRINPEDNHGIRPLLINHYLRAHDDEKAIELAKLYPHDILVDVKFGEILAKYRLGKIKEAESLLGKAHDEHPLIAKTLWRKRVKQPALDPLGVVVGGKDEAWLYRQDMREEWASTPGALDWIKKTEGQCT